MPRLLWFAVAALLSCSSPSENQDKCLPDDADGIVGTDAAFELTVDDVGFAPAILAAQNRTNVRLTLHNAGTRAHDFVIDCMPTPNDNGCPLTSCFPTGAAIPPVDPGASASTTFVVPNPEGIYYYHSSLTGDAPPLCSAGASGCGQFIVK